MKIAFLSFYSGEVARGVETLIHEIANGLTNLGHDVVVYQNGKTLPDSQYKTKSIDLNVDWKRSSHIVPIFNYWSFLVGRFTLKVLKQIDNETDIIFPTNGQLQSVFTSIWSRFHKAKLIIGGQSGPGIDDRINVWSFPDVFIGLTDFQVKWAKRVNPFINVKKVPNGANIKKFSNSESSIKHGLKQPVVLCVAALNKWKRLDLVIKAVSRLNDASLLLVGRGDKEKELRRLGKRLLGGRFKIMSFPYNEMPKIYPSTDLFVYPTIPSESFGIVMVEAMASGLAVVATDDPIRREIVEKAGFFVDPTDTEKFAETIKKALKKDWGKAPRKQAEKFDWDKIAKKYEDLFEELL